jgi:hypothetical protein
LVAGSFFRQSFVFFSWHCLNFVVLALLTGLLLTFEQLGLGCFFALGLEVFTG